MKRLNQIHAYKFKVKRAVYIVTLEHLKNDIYGCPRYKAVIICNTAENLPSYYNAVYTFRGHYWTDKDEAQYILDEFIKESLKDQK